MTDLGSIPSASTERELLDYLERIRHRLTVRPDDAATCIRLATEAITLARGENA
jgi:hypothetical protein